MRNRYLTVTQFLTKRKYNKERIIHPVRKVKNKSLNEKFEDFIFSRAENGR